MGYQCLEIIKLPKLKFMSINAYLTTSHECLQINSLSSILCSPAYASLAHIVWDKAPFWCMTHGKMCGIFGIILYVIQNANKK